MTEHAIECQIMANLISRFDNSAESRGLSKKPANIFLDATNGGDALFRDYVHPQADYPERLEAAANSLEQAGFVIIRRLSDNRVCRISLNTDRNKIEEARKKYKLNPDPRVREDELLKVFNKYLNDEDTTVSRYASEMVSDLCTRRKLASVQLTFNGKLSDLADIITAIKAIHKLGFEERERDFSNRVFGYSKRFAEIAGKVDSILRKYSGDGEFDEKESPSRMLGVVSNPTFALIKGDIKIRVGNQVINVGDYPGTFALYDMAISEMEVIGVGAKRVLTIENLTTFYDFKETGTLAVYLGGFHNAVRRELLVKIYECRNDLEYMHWGDIDAGGFYIFNHLRERTAIPFIPFRMGKDELIAHQKQWVPGGLSGNDVKRLKNQLAKEEFACFHAAISYMLEHNCKLEQEAFSEITLV